jgi:hypothetical protein
MHGGQGTRVADPLSYVRGLGGQQSRGAQHSIDTVLEACLRPTCLKSPALRKVFAQTCTVAKAEAKGLPAAAQCHALIPIS